MYHLNYRVPILLWLVKKLWGGNIYIQLTLWQPFWIVTSDKNGCQVLIKENFLNTFLRNLTIVTANLFSCISNTWNFLIILLVWIWKRSLYYCYELYFKSSENKAWKKNWGFDPMTSGYQCSALLTELNKPTGSWSLCWFLILLVYN